MENDAVSLLCLQAQTHINEYQSRHHKFYRDILASVLHSKKREPGPSKKYSLNAPFNFCKNKMAYFFYLQPLNYRN